MARLRLMGYTKMSDAVAEYIREQLSNGTSVWSIAFDLRTAFIASMPDQETSDMAIEALAAYGRKTSQEVK